VDRTVVIVLAVFAALAALGIFLSVRQGARQRAAIREFASSHGWKYTRRDASQLGPILDQTDPSQSWTAYDIVLAEGPPASLYLFRYSASAPYRDTPDTGFGCLAERTGWGNEEPVSVTPRARLVEKLMGDRVEVGEPEFRREFVVMCRRLDVAAWAVNREVQKILLEHAADPQWFLTVRIAGGRVLVTTSWAKKPQEWDYLLTLTGRLRRAIR
jgi:hypothetical protein